MAKDAKLIRGQVRQVVKEVLGEVLTQELVAAIRKQLQDELRSSMTNLDTDVRLSLDSVNKRYTELNSYIISTVANQLPLPEPTAPTPPPETI